MKTPKAHRAPSVIEVPRIAALWLMKIRVRIAALHDEVHEFRARARTDGPLAGLFDDDNLAELSSALEAADSAAMTMHLVCDFEAVSPVTYVDQVGDQRHEH